MAKDQEENANRPTPCVAPSGISRSLINLCTAACPPTTCLCVGSEISILEAELRSAQRRIFAIHSTSINTQNGKMIAQSQAMLRYVAKVSSFVGASRKHQHVRNAALQASSHAPIPTPLLYLNATQIGKQPRLYPSCPMKSLLIDQALGITEDVRGVPGVCTNLEFPVP